MNSPDPIFRVEKSFVAIAVVILFIGSIHAKNVPAAISTNVVQSICHQMRKFSESGDLQAPVKSKPRFPSSRPCGWHRWGNCGGRDSVCSYVGLENCEGDKNARIINGEDAVPNSYPSLGSFFSTESDTQGCSGAIISKNMIITAAHCTVFTFGTPRPLKFVAGEHNISLKEPNEQTVQVKRCVEHPDFCTSSSIMGGPDIAICITSEPFTFNEFVSPAELPPHGYVASGRVMAMGWGLIENIEGGGQRADILQQAEMSAITDEECLEFEDKYKTHESQDLWKLEEQFCVLEPGKAMCGGDSGSPLYKITGKTQTVLGPLSGGSFCGLGLPNFYLDAAYFRSWIDEVMAKFSSEQETADNTFSYPRDQVQPCKR